MYSCALALENLRLKLHLGVTAAERNKKQVVLVCIKISFLKPPLGCKTGKISDTICYAKLISKIKNFCENKKFILIEELGAQLFNIIKKNVPAKCKLRLRVAKQRPLPDLSHSVFEIN